MAYRHEKEAEAAAQALCAQIERYWRDRGYNDIRVWAQSYVSGAYPSSAWESTFWEIKSNIGPDGLPPGERSITTPAQRYAAE